MRCVTTASFLQDHCDLVEMKVTFLQMLGYKALSCIPWLVLMKSSLKHHHAPSQLQAAAPGLTFFLASLAKMLKAVCSTVTKGWGVQKEIRSCLRRVTTQTCRVQSGLLILTVQSPLLSCRYTNIIKTVFLLDTYTLICVCVCARAV